jgi:catechol 2,3-dioxygenase-like lactoylglutathione lyase family enzyme
MGYFAGESSSSSTRCLAERALKKPSSVIWLGHVCLTTTRFEDALGFYSCTLGLSLRTVERHPLHFDRLRAVLIDAEGRDAVELVEAHAETTQERENPVVNQLCFRLPRRSWQALRARLETSDVPYEKANGVLSLRDPDGVRLRVEPLGMS